LEQQKLGILQKILKNGVNEEVVLASQTKQRSCGELPIAVVAGAGNGVNLNT